LLAGSRVAPAPVAPRSAQVCACHDVSAAAIAATLPLCAGTPEQRLQALQQRLHCGTACGSCLPALRTLLREHPEPLIA
ncbi:MAG: (2Fe-2S)-binding protein, partial [Burkholderiales bacterium]|nr:(2Fe-2S)-binding protein [Burkholderiales bacterium]